MRGMDEVKTSTITLLWTWTFAILRTYLLMFLTTFSRLLFFKNTSLLSANVDMLYFYLNCHFWSVCKQDIYGNFVNTVKSVV